MTHSICFKYNNIHHEYFSKYIFTICFSINIPTSREYLSQTEYDTLTPNMDAMCSVKYITKGTVVYDCYIQQYMGNTKMCQMYTISYHVYNYHAMSYHHNILAYFSLFMVLSTAGLLKHQSMAHINGPCIIFTPHILACQVTI